PPQKWAELTTGDYRQRQLEDPRSFEAQLVMYRVKVGYVALGRVLGLVLPPLLALQAINALSLLLIAGVASLWLRGMEEAAVFVVPAWMAMHLIEVAAMFTPDLLCAALALAGVALLRFERPAWAAIVLAIATLVRPDFVLFPAAFLFVTLVSRRSWRAALPVFGLSV